MLVYRVTSRIEIDKIIEHKSFKKIGSTNFDGYCNSHNYKKNTYYMHFFLSKEDIFYLNNFMKRFICTYDIPDYLIKTYLGIGKYISKYSDKMQENINECAIPSKLIKLSYLESIEVLPLKYEYTDYLLNNSYNTTLIYSKSHENILKKWYLTLTT